MYYSRNRLSALGYINGNKKKEVVRCTMARARTSVPSIASDDRSTIKSNVGANGYKDTDEAKDEFGLGSVDRVSIFA